MKKFKNTGFLAIMLLTTGFAHSVERQERAQRALLNIKDNQGATPLHRAVENNHFDSAKVLLENGARPNVKDNNGQTPLHYAVKLENGAEFIKLLIKHGARPNARDTQDRRAIDLTDKSEVKELLVSLGTRIRKNKLINQEQQVNDQQASSITLEELPETLEEAKAAEEIGQVLEEIVKGDLPEEQAQAQNFENAAQDLQN